MCYAKPGPRCSNHAEKELRLASQEVGLVGEKLREEDFRKLGYWPHLAEYQAAEERWKQANIAYHETPAGIAALREKGLNAQADIAAAKRKAMIAAYKQANPTAKLKAEDKPYSVISPTEQATLKDLQAEETQDSTIPDSLRADYSIDCTGDACVGDEVAFMRATFSGSYRKPTFTGYELVEGKILRDSYGADKQQHTFTLELPDGTTTRIKGRNLYANGMYRKERDATERQAVLNEKHQRGDAARASRAERREEASQVGRF